MTQSGVQIGDNLLSLTDAKIRRNLEANRYIAYEGHEFDYNGTLTLHITERLGMAVVQALGNYYVMDASGVVLEGPLAIYPDSVSGPKVSGFEIDKNTRIMVGCLLPVRDVGQLESMERVLLALEKASMLGRVSLVDVHSRSNLYAMTTEGAKIVLGDDKNLTTKLLIAREVLNIRTPMGKLKGAKIDVSSGKDAHYIPDVLPTVTPVMTPTPIPTPEPTPF